MADRRSGDSEWKSAAGGSNTEEVRYRLAVRTHAIKCARALGTIEGLGGFVGVDFIWDEQRRQATILEINPRPTTSLVGLCRLLPAGRLARAWLEVFRSAERDEELLGSLYGLIQSGEAVVFNADGEFADHRESIEP